jgi:RND superfamily putative drug exporter
MGNSAAEHSGSAPAAPTHGGFLMTTAKAIAGLPSGRRTKWAVLVFWLVVAVVASPLAGKLMGAEKNDAKSWLPAAAESTRVLAIQDRVQSANVFPAVIVYYRASGLTAADRAKATADIRRFARVRHVVPGQAAGPFLAADKKAIETIVNVDLGSKGPNAAAHAASSLRALAGSGDVGLSAYITGPLGSAADADNALNGIDTTLLFSALAVVIILLLITYRSPVLWLLPVISVFMALTSAEAVIYLLAAHAGLTVNTQAAGILYVLVFGAGTDYALLLTARYREELRTHQDRHEAMQIALRRAGPAIIASGGTVIAGMLTLSVASLNAIKGMGPVLAIGVAVALLAMLTLLPALLVITGRWVFWPRRPAYGSAEPTTTGAWARVGSRLSARPGAVWVSAAVVLGVLSFGLLGLNANGLTNAQSYRGTPDSVVGQRVLAAHFPGGAGEPVIVVGRAEAAGRIEAAVRRTAGITAVTPQRQVAGETYLEATLRAAPDSPAAFATVDRVRAAVHAIPGAGALVGGDTAINLDVQRASAHDRNLIIPLLLGVVFVILALLLRALVAALILIATVVLSFGAALGVSTLAFTHLFGFGAEDSSFPLFVFVFLVALGVDYNIFLMTRVREEATRQDPRSGAVKGLAATGGVITSAGAVLAGTFAVLGTLPLTVFTEIGFAVAFGVLLDTFIVRSVLVTALNLDLGRWMWWPSGLSRELAGDVPKATIQPTTTR